MYIATILPNLDLVITTPNSTINIKWLDSDFQAWLAQQSADVQSQFQLSAAQQAILAAKNATFQGFQTWLSNQYGANPPMPQGVARLIYELMQRALKDQIV